MASHNLEMTKRIDFLWELDPKDHFINDGAFGRVFKMPVNSVVKIGFVEPQEVILQQFYAGQELAPRVYEYYQHAWMPERWRRATCYIHGVHKKADWRWCTCQEYNNLLFMQYAESPYDNGYTREQVQTFCQIFEKQISHDWNFEWDARPRNVGCIKGKLVALDFGKE